MCHNKTVKDFLEKEECNKFLVYCGVLLSGWGNFTYWVVIWGVSGIEKPSHSGGGAASLIQQSRG